MSVDAKSYCYRTESGMESMLNRLLQPRTEGWIQH